jgi:Flp pilus assembly protein TadD
MRYVTTTSLLLALASCSDRQPASTLPLQPPPPPLASWKPTLHLADSALLDGAPMIALQVTDELLSSEPRNVAALVRRGDALVALDRVAEAGTSYGKALEIEPQNGRAIVGLGKVRLTQDPAAAETLFVQAAMVNPHDAVALGDLGVARDIQGHHAAAQEAYRLALGAAPSSVAVQVNLGLSMALSGKAAEAVHLLQPLAAAPNALPRVRQDLALALLLSGHRDEASSILVNELSPDQARRALDGFEALKP